MKYKQLMAMANKTPEGHRTSFEELMANLNVSLGFVIADNVSLARYCEYKKIISKKLEAEKNKHKK